MKQAVRFSVVMALWALPLQAAKQPEAAQTPQANYVAEVFAAPNFAPHMQRLQSQRLTADDASADLMAQLSRVKSFSAHYQQQVFDNQQQLLQQGQGVLLLQQGGFFRFESTEPEPALLVSDGQSLWFYNELLEQVSIYDAKSEVGQTPFALLTSADTALWQDYQVTMQQQQFYIHPLDSNNPVQQLVLQFSDDILQQMQVIDINQQQSVFMFSQAKLNPVLAKETFHFTVTPELDVDDQRLREN
ncbi:outer membrane lipoprotein chaperone LolA [Arsukibacterium sp.]|uniref:outer membrane lipoprotein chaperone LolA n=1 Tax=Arsukibacterium sp. TaxID=1977258 RepID=UPI002FDA1BA4